MTDSHVSPRRRFGTVRVRTTVAAVAVVGLALLVAAVVLVTTLTGSLRRDVERTARLRAGDIALALEGGIEPQALALNDGDETFVQVVEGGEVIASSPKIDELDPVGDIGPRETLTLEGLPGEEDDPFIVVSAPVAGSDGPLIVLVGRSLDPVEDSSAIVRRTLLIGMPLLLLIVGLTTWGVVGRALRSVESIRKQVAEISTSQLHRRVPNPRGDDEIARLARTMNSMLSRLEAEQQRQRRFVSDASHELRSPVTAIRNLAEVASAHPDRTEVEELSASVLAEEYRLERLVDDLLILAQNDEGLGAMTLQDVDLDDIVLEEAERIRGTTRLDVDTSKVSGGRTPGDAAQLRRAVRNLVDNAARHARTRMVLAITEEDDRILLVVEDDGPGIAAENRATVFERFTRLDDARDREHGGTGLGLAIVAEIVHRHGGTIAIADASIGGARFEVRLPKAH